MSATLLIVDDEKNTRDGLRNALDADFEVYVAPDADGDPVLGACGDPVPTRRSISARKGRRPNAWYAAQTVGQSTSAIIAALNPTPSPYYFFQANCSGTGYHNFSETYAEHLAKSCN
jgi:hypothetical protein